MNPRERIVLVRNTATLGRNTLLVKLTPFEPSELEVIKEICLNRMPINYAPPSLMAEVDRTPGLISEPKTRKLIEAYIATVPQEREMFYAQFPYRVRPVTDNKPFFNNMRYFTRDMKDTPQRVTEEIEEYTQQTWYIPHIPIGSVAQLVVLVEAAVFALVLLIFPLWRFKSEGIRTRWQKLSMLYFLSLGLGFIWIEVVLLKIFILFLGNPVYSIAVVLFAMLIFAGLGSLCSERLKGKLKYNLSLIGCILTLMVLSVALLYPLLFQICLGFPFSLRILVTVGLIAPLGFILGIPFPLGLEFLAKTSPESIPWAWAMNGYATVIGVSSSALLALQTGFAALLGISLGVYFLGFLCLHAGQMSWSRQPEAISG